MAKVNEHICRFQSEGRAAAILGLPLATFRALVTQGRLPKPDPELGLYDMKALDAALDRLSGLGSPSSALEGWREKRRNAR
jgi:hypothetical protein